MGARQSHLCKLFEAGRNRQKEETMNIYNVPLTMMKTAQLQKITPDGEEIRMTPGGRSTVTYANQDNVVVVQPKPVTLTKSVWILGAYHEDTAPESWRDVQYTKWRGELITFEVSSDEQ
jgi:hypothetical protein